jgi:hypothetical protein
MNLFGRKIENSIDWNRNHFSILRFNLFRFSALAYSRFFFASSQAGRWPSGQGAGHYNQDVDTVVV